MKKLGTVHLSQNSFEVVKNGNMGPIQDKLGAATSYTRAVLTMHLNDIAKTSVNHPGLQRVLDNWILEAANNINEDIIDWQMDYSQDGQILINGRVCDKGLIVGLNDSILNRLSHIVQSFNSLISSSNKQVELLRKERACLTPVRKNLYDEFGSIIDILDKPKAIINLDESFMELDLHEEALMYCSNPSERAHIQLEISRIKDKLNLIARTRFGWAVSAIEENRFMQGEIDASFEDNDRLVYSINDAVNRSIHRLQQDGTNFSIDCNDPVINSQSKLSFKKFNLVVYNNSKNQELTFDGRNNAYNYFKELEVKTPSDDLKRILMILRLDVPSPLVCIGNTIEFHGDMISSRMKRHLRGIRIEISESKSYYIEIDGSVTLDKGDSFEKILESKRYFCFDFSTSTKGITTHYRIEIQTTPKLTGALSRTF